ncbi:MAG: flavodoxin family protein [Desulfatibacillaceae bacterium]
MNDTRPLILGVTASPRAGGNTDELLDAALEAARAAGGETRTVHLRRYTISPCVGCERCRKDKACTKLYDGMQLLYPLIEQADGLVFGTPVHNYNVTAWAKAFIDRLYCYYDFTDDRPRGWSSRLAGRGKKAVVFVIGEQPDEESMGIAVPAMALPLEALGFEVLDKITVMGHFDKGIVARDRDAMGTMRQAGNNLAAALDGGA